MEPSKIKVITAKVTKLLPSSFKAIMWCGVAYCHSKTTANAVNEHDYIDSNFKCHETIHVRQAQSMHDSWFRFYVRYIWEWLCNLPLITINIHAPYKFMPLEIEAYFREKDWDYPMRGECHEWREYETLSLKEKKLLAKAYYGKL